jgi:hypothetical protein
MPAKAAVDIKLGHRKIYIKGRIPDVRQEMKNISEEKKRIIEQMKTANAGDQKRLNHRRIFLLARMDALRAEQKELLGEKKAVFGR